MWGNRAEAVMSHLLVAPPVTEVELTVISLVNSFFSLDAEKPEGFSGSHLLIFFHFVVVFFFHPCLQI